MGVLIMTSNGRIIPFLLLMIGSSAERNYNSKFPDENILQFLHGLDPVQLQSCMNINFGLHNSDEKFSFSQLPMIPDDLGREKIRNLLTNNPFDCYIVSI